MMRKFSVCSIFIVAALVGMISVLGGCQLFGVLAYAVTGDDGRKVDVKSQYVDLAYRKTAVIVALPEDTYRRYPTAQKRITQMIARRLQLNVEGVRIINPDHIVSFQNENPYWNTLLYSELADAFNVDRLILVDVNQYSMYEPGNQNVMQGVIVADVGVIEAANPETGEVGSGNNLAFQQIVEVRYPEDTELGVPDGDQATVELATVATFAERAVWLFHDHEEVVKE